VIASLCASTAVAAAGFPVVDGGRRATIVFSRDAVNPPKKRWQWTMGPDDAYKQLAEYVEKTTDERLAVVMEGDFEPGGGKFPIYIGKCRTTQEALGDELRQLDREGYLIVIDPSRAFLVGPQLCGTYWATCQFLEDYLGVRWLMPGPLGEDIVKRERVVLSPVRRRSEPVILARTWHGFHYGGDEACRWSLRHRVALSGFGYHERHRASHHALPYPRLFDPSKFDKYPSYYPIRDGKRFRPTGRTGWSPCLTEPGTVRYAADAAQASWAEGAYSDDFSLSVADNAISCECSGCKTLWQKGSGFPGIADWMGKDSTLYYTWLTRVAKELEPTHPNRLLGCLAYQHVTVPPPKHVSISRHILPYITLTIADQYAPECRRTVRPLIEAWGQRVDQIGFYDYAYGPGFVLPRIYTHILQHALKHGLKHNLTGVFAEVSPNWGLDAPRLYCTAALWWNPHVDVDAVFDEWNDRMFREAAEPMKKYFRRCEQAWAEYDGFWERGESRSRFDIFMRTPHLEVYPPEVLAECTSHLDEAGRQAQSDLVRRRVHFFRKTWDLGLVFAGQYWPTDELRELIADSAPIERAARALQKLPALMTLRDFRRVIDERMGDDKLAFFRGVRGHWLPVPGRPERSWIQDYRTAGAEKTYHWFVERLTPPAIDRAKRDGALTAGRVQQVVTERIREVFPAGGSSAYQEAVAHIGKTATKIVDVGKTTSLPRIDGDLNDAAWGSAAELSGFTVRGSSLTPAKYATTARITHDGASLYAAVECSRYLTASRPPAISGNLAFPGTWHVFAPLKRDDPLLPEAVLRTIPREIVVAGRKVKSRLVMPKECKIDFRDVCGPTHVGWTCYVFLPLESAKSQKVTFGLGADWWMQAWLDGRQIFDNTATEKGNVRWPIAISNHTVTTHMSAGRHVLALRFISGKASSGLAIGGPNELRQIPRGAWVGEACELWTTAQPPERDGGVEHDDYVALTIRSDKSSGTWSRFVVNPAGALLDERGRDGKTDRSHDFNCEWAAKIYPDRWTAEIRVPLSEAELNPASDPLVRMNVFRSIAGDGSRRGILTWYPQPIRGPHWAQHNLGWCILRGTPDDGRRGQR